MKQCRECQETLPLESFSLAKENKDGHNNKCKKCVQIWSKAYRAAMSEEDRKIMHRKRNLKDKFGMSIEDYEEMAEAQQHSCAICGGDNSERGRYLDVDHDHHSGAIRMLLCNKCNQGLGYFQDSLELLEKAVDYLRKFQ